MAHDSPVQRAAEDTAQRIEHAVKKGDSNGYVQIATNEIGDYGKTHSAQQAKEYMDTVTKKLQDDHVLPAVAIFEAQRDFSGIDSRGNDRLTKEQISKYETNGGLNDFRKGLIDNVLQDYDRIRNYNTSFESFWGGNSAAITKTDIDKGVREERALLNLYAKDENGKSLADRITNPNGDINPSAIESLLYADKKGGGVLLTPEQRDAIGVLNDNQSFWQRHYAGADDLKHTDLARMARQSGTDLTALQSMRDNSDSDRVPKQSETDRPILRPPLMVGDNPDITHYLYSRAIDTNDTLHLTGGIDRPINIYNTVNPIQTQYPDISYMHLNGPRVPDDTLEPATRPAHGHHRLHPQSREHVSGIHNAPNKHDRDWLAAEKALNSSGHHASNREISRVVKALKAAESGE